MSLELNHILRVTAQMRSTATNSRFQNVFWYQCSDLVSQVFADIKSDFTTILNAMYDTIKGWCRTELVSEGFRLVDVTSKETYGNTAWTFAGTAAVDEALPPQVCGEILAYTFDAGRYGRKYLGPFTENSQVHGTWQAGVITAMQNFGNIYQATQVGAATANTYLAGVARKVGGVYQFKQFATALGYYVVPDARTQRRRTSGFGLT